MITLVGQQSLLKMMWQANVTDVASGGNFYLGICDANADEADILADVTGEPTGAGGYARQAISRDAIGWPTISAVNGIWRARSVAVNFAASGADFDKPLHRLFLCNAASGTTGILYGYSSALTMPVTITDGTSYPASFQLFVDS